MGRLESAKTHLKRATQIDGLATNFRINAGKGPHRPSFPRWGSFYRSRSIRRRILKTLLGRSACSLHQIGASGGRTHSVHGVIDLVRNHETDFHQPRDWQDHQPEEHEHYRPKGFPDDLHLSNSSFLPIISFFTPAVRVHHARLAHPERRRRRARTIEGSGVALG
jgi:hypothetical protein